MKKLLIIIALFTAFGAEAQKTIPNPGCVLDTTYNGYRYKFFWTGNIRLFPADSVVNDTAGAHPNYNYLSVDYSLIKMELSEQIIVGQDTLFRTKWVTRSFRDIYTPVKNFLGAAPLRNDFKQSLKDEYKKRLKNE